MRHSPGVVRHVKYKGGPPVKGKHVTGFTNGEEEAVKLSHVVPLKNPASSTFTTQALLKLVGAERAPPELAHDYGFGQGSGAAASAKTFA